MEESHEERLNRIKERWAVAIEFAERNFGMNQVSDDEKYMIERAEEALRYEMVIKEMKQAYDSMCKTLTLTEWTSGFGAGIDFIEENLYGAAKRECE